MTSRRPAARSAAMARRAPGMMLVASCFSAKLSITGSSRSGAMPRPISKL